VYNILPQIDPATPSTAGQVSPPELVFSTQKFHGTGS